MIEMAAIDATGGYQRGYAGDSYNTAVYLARAGHSVSYLTRLGDSRFSNDILRELKREAIDTTYIECAPGEEVGLYTIQNDERGERSFSYWRSQSAARKLFREPPPLTDIDLFYFTGITAAVTRANQNNLVQLLEQLKTQGTRIAFDPNYRPALWESVDQARSSMHTLLPLCDIVLPTLDDERALHGLQNAQECAAHFAQYSIDEVVLKGDDGLAQVIHAGETTTAQATLVEARDTTGAGDAFNAGYLASRLHGGGIADALNAAQALASQVVQHPGAILPRNKKVH